MKRVRSASDDLATSDKVVAKMTRPCRSAWFDYERDIDWSGRLNARIAAARAFKAAWDELSDQLLDITTGA
jgi:hypothetical protein